MFTVAVLVVAGVSKSSQTEIENLHNKLRATVSQYDQPAATNMLKLYWDDEIAMIAQKQADSCVYGHDQNIQRNIPGRLTLGQNIATGQRSWKEAIMDWFLEVHDYKYGVGKKSEYKIVNGARVKVMVGHYTQIVWAKTSRIGCGYAYCPSLPYKHHYVCNYGPGGNVGKQKPYEIGGSQASACPSTRADGLCDCKNKICLNLGTMNPNTCQCSCVASFHRKSDCGCKYHSTPSEDLSE
ncbi:cysteine-rich venom protein VAR8-like [Tubulanus polymorphus]|uniref:cysteine-rich venom protein VAR8-like n=1 Tax=Tubulanus polymorphus TaxID=672921 RepID=UPI003DA5B317